MAIKRIWLICALLVFFVFIWLTRGFEGQEDRKTLTQEAFTLSLQAGANKAWLCGQERELKSAVFVENGIFYLPLQELVSLLGGSCKVEGAYAQVQLFGATMEYTLGERAYRIDGNRYEVEDLRNSGASALDVDAFVPRVKDGIFYIPAQFAHIKAPTHALATARAYPQEGVLILGYFAKELGLGDIFLEDSYAQLPLAQRRDLQDKGIVDKVLNYEIREYANTGLSIYVMEAALDSDDGERMHGKICGIFARDARYASPRGLKVGDEQTHIFLLYGTDHVSSSEPSRIVPISREGVLVALAVQSRYFSVEG